MSIHDLGRQIWQGKAGPDGIEAFRAAGGAWKDLKPLFEGVVASSGARYEVKARWAEVREHFFADIAEVIKNSPTGRKMTPEEVKAAEDAAFKFALEGGSAEDLRTYVANLHDPEGYQILVPNELTDCLLNKVRAVSSDLYEVRSGKYVNYLAAAGSPAAIREFIRNGGSRKDLALAIENILRGESASNPRKVLNLRHELADRLEVAMNAMWELYQSKDRPELPLRRKIAFAVSSFFRARNGDYGRELLSLLRPELSYKDTAFFAQGGTLEALKRHAAALNIPEIKFLEKFEGRGLPSSEEQVKSILALPGDQGVRRFIQHEGNLEEFVRCGAKWIKDGLSPRVDRKEFDSDPDEDLFSDDETGGVQQRHADLFLDEEEGWVQEHYDEDSDDVEEKKGVVHVNADFSLKEEEEGLSTEGEEAGLAVYDDLESRRPLPIEEQERILDKMSTALTEAAALPIYQVEGPQKIELEAAQKLYDVTEKRVAFFKLAVEKNWSEEVTQEVWQTLVERGDAERLPSKTLHQILWCFSLFPGDAKALWQEHKPEAEREPLREGNILSFCLARSASYAEPTGCQVLLKAIEELQGKKNRGTWKSQEQQQFETLQQQLELYQVLLKNTVDTIKDSEKAPRLHTRTLESYPRVNDMMEFVVQMARTSGPRAQNIWKELISQFRDPARQAIAQQNLDEAMARFFLPQERSVWDRITGAGAFRSAPKTKRVTVVAEPVVVRELAEPSEGSSQVHSIVKRSGSHRGDQKTADYGLSQLLEGSDPARYQPTNLGINFRDADTRQNERGLRVPLPPVDRSPYASDARKAGRMYASFEAYRVSGGRISFDALQLAFTRACAVAIMENKFIREEITGTFALWIQDLPERFAAGEFVTTDPHLTDQLKADLIRRIDERSTIKMTFNREEFRTLIGGHAEGGAAAETPSGKAVPEVVPQNLSFFRPLISAYRDGSWADDEERTVEFPMFHTTSSRIGSEMRENVVDRLDEIFALPGFVEAVTDLDPGIERAFKALESASEMATYQQEGGAPTKLFEAAERELALFSVQRNAPYRGSSIESLHRLRSMQALLGPHLASDPQLQERARVLNANMATQIQGVTELDLAFLGSSQDVGRAMDQIAGNLDAVCDRGERMVSQLGLTDPLDSTIKFEQAKKMLGNLKMMQTQAAAGSDDRRVRMLLYRLEKAVAFAPLRLMFKESARDDLFPHYLEELDKLIAARGSLGLTRDEMIGIFRAVRNRVLPPALADEAINRLASSSGSRTKWQDGIQVLEERAKRIDALYPSNGGPGIADAYTDVFTVFSSAFQWMEDLKIEGRGDEAKRNITTLLSLCVELKQHPDRVSDEHIIETLKELRLDCVDPKSACEVLRHTLPSFDVLARTYLEEIMDPQTMSRDQVVTALMIVQDRLIPPPIPSSGAMKTDEWSVISHVLDGLAKKIDAVYPVEGQRIANRYEGAVGLARSMQNWQAKAAAVVPRTRNSDPITDEQMEEALIAIENMTRVLELHAEFKEAPEQLTDARIIGTLKSLGIESGDPRVTCEVLRQMFRFFEEWGRQVLNDTQKNKPGDNTRTNVTTTLLTREIPDQKRWTEAVQTLLAWNRMLAPLHVENAVQIKQNITLLEGELE